MAHIMVDIDDVIFPMIVSVHEVAGRLGLHDGSREPEQWRGWEQYGCTEAEFWEAWNAFRDGGGYVDTDPIAGALAALAAAKRDGHHVHLVTARGCAEVAVPGVDNEFVRAATRQWLERVRAAYDTLTFIRHKPSAQEELGVRFDVAFDDHPGNVITLREHGVRAFLVDQPHNRIDPLARGLCRVESLADGLLQLGLIDRGYACVEAGEHVDLNSVMEGGHPMPVQLICAACGAVYDRRS